ncbi:hypothetical protein BX661DRAFT_185527 [Kickxella alabastrina]|uniref:uncharacterized protein n=1 Tax=Kickxella alabastrina TaxID=61397 RepID=UPI00221ED579|nr:uncharacterized protein BX661DRAFT_185527 [Kickxella alabastrina]KAI7824555.1 hypothetical protein BX661DRAFT_185527 [Kickxella alabastrina]
MLGLTWLGLATQPTHCFLEPTHCFSLAHNQNSGWICAHTQQSLQPTRSQRQSSSLNNADTTYFLYYRSAPIFHKSVVHISRACKLTTYHMCATTNQPRVFFGCDEKWHLTSKKPVFTAHSIHVRNARPYFKPHVTFIFASHTKNTILALALFRLPLASFLFISTYELGYIKKPYTKSGTSRVAIPLQRKHSDKLDNKASPSISIISVDSSIDNIRGRICSETNRLFCVGANAAFSSG